MEQKIETGGPAFPAPDLGEHDFGTAWTAFGYVSLVSMWAAFFAWYRALDWGGPVRVSQVQALQPFFAIALSVPLLGDVVDAWTMGCAVVVIACVGLAQRSAGTGR